MYWYGPGPETNGLRGGFRRAPQSIPPSQYLSLSLSLPTGLQEPDRLYLAFWEIVHDTLCDDPPSPDHQSRVPQKSFTAYPFSVPLSLSLFLVGKKREVNQSS